MNADNQVGEEDYEYEQSKDFIYDRFNKIILPRADLHRTCVTWLKHRKSPAAGVLTFLRGSLVESLSRLLLCDTEFENPGSLEGLRLCNSVSNEAQR